MSAGELPGTGSDLTAFSKLKIKHSHQVNVLFATGQVAPQPQGHFCSASGADSPGSISLIIYLDFKMEKKKDQPTALTFFFFTSNNQSVWHHSKPETDKKFTSRKKSEGTSELQTGTPGGLRLRSEWCHQSIQAARLSHKTFCVELNSFKHRRTPFFSWTKILKCVIYSMLPQFLYEILAAESFPNVKKYQHLHTFRVFF